MGLRRAALTAPYGQKARQHPQRPFHVVLHSANALEGVSQTRSGASNNYHICQKQVVALRLTLLSCLPRTTSLCMACFDNDMVLREHGTCKDVSR